MHFKAPPTACECPKCGWKQVVVPTSDVLMLPSTCPKCGAEPLSRRPATTAELVLAQLKQMTLR